MFDKMILKSIQTISDKNHIIPDWIFISKFLYISTEKDKENLKERVIALVDSNLIALVNSNFLIKKSSDSKDCFFLNPEIILDASEAAGNTTSTIVVQQTPIPTKKMNLENLSS